MTPEQIDQLLLLWKSRLEAVAAALVEFRLLPGYEMLEKLPLAGETKLQIGPAIALMDKVWPDFDLLSRTVQRAVDLRAKISRFTVSPQNWREIESILFGASVPAPEQPIASRDLLGMDETGYSITLQQLLDRMNAAFVQGRDGVLKFDAAWKTLNAKLSPAVAFLDAHPAESAAGMVELRRMIEALRPAVMNDPIGANTEFEQRIAPLLARVRAAVGNLEAQRRSLCEDLTAARDLIKTLSECRMQNEKAYQECREKVVGPSAELPLPITRMKELSDALERLEARSATATDEVCEELACVSDELRHLITKEESALALNRAPVELRQELRGRLSALKAKASARGRIEEPELVRVADRASSLLYTRPTPIQEAAGLVFQYEAMLNGRDINK